MLSPFAKHRSMMTVVLAIVAVFAVFAAQKPPRLTTTRGSRLSSTVRV